MSDKSRSRVLNQWEVVICWTVGWNSGREIRKDGSLPLVVNNLKIESNRTGEKCHTDVGCVKVASCDELNGTLILAACQARDREHTPFWESSKESRK